MRLVKAGIDPKNVIHNARCYNCASEYEFKLSDPEVYVSCDQLNNNAYSFICQVCSQTVYYNPPKDR